MSATSRARAHERNIQIIADFRASQAARLEAWWAAHYTLDQRAALKAAAEAEHARGEPQEPRPFWCLEVGEVLLCPHHWWPPTPPDGKPILSLVAFHHSLPNPVPFERTDLGAPWVRVA